jgi:tellurite resistance protein TerC
MIHPHMNDGFLEGSIGYPPSVIALFIVFVLGCLAVDLLAHKKDKVVSLTSAIIWSCVWVGVSLLFYGYLFWQYGSEHASLFLTGYALEKVLSVDNLMVFVAIFAAFKVPEEYRHRVLFYGVIGAIVFRLLFVTAGAWLYALGPWVDFLFAAIIAWTAYKMLQSDDDEGGEVDYAQHSVVKWARKIFPVWPKLEGHNFFVSKRRAARLLAEPQNAGLQVQPGAAFYVTPLFLCLIMIELADVIFAFDSIPAVIAVTKDPLLVYTAMIFAIMGLRQLYFVLAALQRYLRHLGTAVIILLFFIAGKLVISASNKIFGWPGFKIDPNFSLMVVITVLALGVVASIIWPEKKKEA